MSFIGDIFGNVSKAAPLQQGATAEQATAANNAVNGGLSQQQQFLAALQAQNGVGNQSQVFNSLGAIANGQGPNPAQAQLANSTGQNVANQASLAAGQRGASQNVGMIARGAAQQGANIQQNAAGQAAALQAQQQLGALGQQGQIAGQQVQMQGQANQAYNQAALGQQSNLLGGINAQNNAAIQNQNMVNQGEKDRLSRSIDTIKGIGGAIATGGASTGLDAAGGKTSMSTDYLNMAQGGEVPAANGAKSMFAQHVMMSKGGEVPVQLSPGEKHLSPEEAKSVASGKDIKAVGKKVPGKAPVKGDSPKNDIVATKAKPGDVIVPRTKADDGEAASKFVQAILAKGSMKGKRK